MGEHFKKPIEDYISRLVERWQLSQPLHLRYLSIVRDTVLKGKSQIYIYYTYNNFKKLVESGKGFWEAVTTVPKGVSEGRNTVAALDAEPDVEDYGFPTLDLDDFHGHYNDATPSECASALYSASKDPVRKRRIDGAHGTTIYRQMVLDVY